MLQVLVPPQLIVPSVIFTQQTKDMKAEHDQTSGSAQIFYEP